VEIFREEPGCEAGSATEESNAGDPSPARGGIRNWQG